MSWRRAALLPLIFVLAACAEGGTRGSGIETEVLGNVVSVDTTAPAATAQATTGLGDIQVSIVGTTIKGSTNDTGDFTVSGNFEGMIELVFTVFDGGTAHIELDVPAAGTLTMNNVSLDTQAGTVTAETMAVEFEGVVTSVDCAKLTLWFVSSQAQHDMDQYVVELATSTVVDSSGQPVPCSDIQTGEKASVQGFVNPDGSYGEATIDLQK